MRQSSGDAVVWHEPGSVVKHGPEAVDASPCESDDGLLVLLSLGAFAVVEGSALGLCKSAEGGSVEGLLECLVAPDGPARSAERRVGNECVSTCRSRVQQYH